MKGGEGGKGKNIADLRAVHRLISKTQKSMGATFLQNISLGIYV